MEQHPDRAVVCDLELRQYGGRRSFSGLIATVRCHEDNSVLRERVGEPGEGRILVVDGGGSRRVALVGDHVAGLAHECGWAGLLIYGCVRDVTSLGALDLGLKALGSTPRPSRKGGTAELDVPVAFGGVTFRPGAMLYSDDDGVVVLDPAS